MRVLSERVVVCKNEIKIMRLSILLILALLVGCAGTAKKTNSLSLGMTKAEVISAMGDPISTRASDGAEYMIYELSSGTGAGAAAACGMAGIFTLGIIYADDRCTGGLKEEYFMKFIDGKLDSYGKVGDFNSTKDPSVNMKVDMSVKQK